MWLEIVNLHSFRFIKLFRSFILLVTKQYLIALAFSYSDYLCQARFFPRTKEHRWITLSRITMVVIREIVRKTGNERHRLVTHGVFGFVRPPGYLGFLVWSIGTQVMLCNPVSTLTFALVVLLFFYTRVPYEEHNLEELLRIEIR